MLQMSSQQVRWKMNALTKRYKECVDSNNKNGRGAVQFEWFDQLDEIFGNNKNNAEPAYTVSSKLCSSPTITRKSTNKARYVTVTNEQNKDRKKEKKKLRESHFMKNVEHTALEEICPPSHIAANSKISEEISTTQVETLKKLRPMHGTG